jgi:hypothetical protein
MRRILPVLVLIAAPDLAHADRGDFAYLTRAPDDTGASVRATGGWDTGADSALGGVEGTVRVWRRIHAIGGAQWTTRDGGTMRPVVGASARLRYVGVSLLYRPEGLTEPEGEIELGVAGARRHGRVTLVGNLTYGQDPEAREMDAEEAGAVVVALGDRVWCGASERLRFALASPPPGEPTWDFIAGAEIVVDARVFALTGFTGVIAREIDDRRERGVQAIVGVGRAFD